MPAIFAFVDAVRSFLLFDFSYLTFEHLALPNFILQAWLPLVSTVGLGYVVCLIASALAWLTANWHVRRCVGIVAFCVVFAFGSLYLTDVRYTQAQTTPLIT